MTMTQERHVRTWEEIQAVLDGMSSKLDEEQGRKRVPKPKPVVKKSANPNSTAKPGVPRPSYNHGEVIRLYRDGMRIGEVAKFLGAHRSTIHRILGPDGANILPVDGEKGGPRRQEKCQRGHPMVSDEDVYQIKGGGRGCRHCKRDRDRANYHVIQQRKRTNQGAS